MANSRLAFVLPAFLAAPGLLLAQGEPLGPNFRVNTYTTSDQSLPSVASDSSGNFVVAWTSFAQYGSGWVVHAQRYASTGAPLGGEFRVNAAVGNSPSVASDSVGDFVVVWRSVDGSENGVFAQRYASTGGPLGGPFRVNTSTSLTQEAPDVAADSAGNFVVVWESEMGIGDADIFAQRYASTGAPLGGQFRVNDYTTDYQRWPSVALDSAGNFVVVWQSNHQDGSGGGIFGRRYDNAGTPLGAEFRINSYTTLAQTLPSVVSDSNGDFVVAWMTDDLISAEISAQRFANTGVPLGGEFRANSVTAGYQSKPSVGSDAAGNFVITWSSDNAVYAQRYTSTGIPLGGQFVVAGAIGSWLTPTVAADAAGNFVIAWQTFAQDGSGSGIFAQRYAMIVPVELQTFVVE